jgi:hypothetical protein
LVRLRWHCLGLPLQENFDLGICEFSYCNYVRNPKGRLGICRFVCV